MRSGAALSAGKNSPVDYFSDAARRIHLCPPKIKDIAKLGLFFVHLNDGYENIEKRPALLICGLFLLLFFFYHCLNKQAMLRIKKRSPQRLPSFIDGFSYFFFKISKAKNHFVVNYFCHAIPPWDRCRANLFHIDYTTLCKKRQIFSKIYWL